MVGLLLYSALNIDYLNPIVEVIDDSNKRLNKTIFCVLERDTNWMWVKYGREKLSK